MEKIRISGHTFDLIPMGISNGDKKRITISTILSLEVETAFDGITFVRDRRSLNDLPRRGIN